MPEIRFIKEIDCDVNIDVYCGTCGRGLCGDTSVDERRMSFTIEACSDCMDRKDEEIRASEKKIEMLENEIEKLKEDLNQ